MNYYYFVASLPMLSLTTPPPFSMERFLDLCDDQLSAPDRAAMDDLLAGPTASTGSHPFVRKWRNGEVQLRNTVAQARAAREKRDATPFLREHEGYDLMIDEGVSDAFSQEDPLSRELTLDRLRWQLAGDAVGGNLFSESAVFAYALRLSLAARWAALDDEQGAELVNGIVNRASPAPGGEDADSLDKAA